MKERRETQELRSRAQKRYWANMTPVERQKKIDNSPRKGRRTATVHQTTCGFKPKQEVINHLEFDAACLRFERKRNPQYMPEFNGYRSGRGKGIDSGRDLE